MFSPRSQLFVTAFLSITVPSVAALAANPASTQREIQNNYNKMALAITRKDVQSATSYFTKDYIGIDQQGTHRTAEETRRYYSAIMPAQIKVVKNQISIQDFSVDRGTAQVSIKQRADMLFGTSKIVSQNTYIDIWVKTPAGWRLKKSQNTSSMTTFNGKQLAS